MENITGGCLCGAVRYTITKPPIVTRACWCKICQTLAAGNATINLAVPENAIAVTGRLKDFPGTADDGNHMHRTFCPICGTHLFSEAEERPNIVVVRAGTLDDTEQVNIEGLIWTASAPSWACLDPDVPHFERQPPAPGSSGS